MPKPSCALEIEEVTKINTSIGATAFNAPTNRVPKKVILLYWGHTRARTAPIMTPVRMRIIRLLFCHLRKASRMYLIIVFISVSDLLRIYNKILMWQTVRYIT